MAITKKAVAIRVKKWKSLMSKWLTALRSGDYKQGAGALHAVSVVDGTPRFCCLGVLADILVKNGVCKKPIFNGKLYKYGGYAGTLYHKVLLQASGLTGRLGVGEFNGNVSECASLAGLNDSGKSFKQIARVIEYELKTNKHGLFKDELFEASKQL